MLDYKLIGNKIKFYRKEKNLTQFKLSEVLDVSDKYIINYVLPKLNIIYILLLKI